MADLFRKLFLFGGAQIPPPTHINVAVTVSSSTLHKHSSDNEFHITLEATLPQTPNTPDKPLTILVFGTLLDTSSIALYENGFNFININTGAPAKRPSLTKHYSFGGMSDIPIEPQFERYFVTLQPGVPHQDQQLPWKVLGKLLGLPTIDQGQYWLNTAPYLDNLLIQCGYDVHKQYQYLAFLHRHVLPVLGPFIRSSVEANYISGFSAEGYPMELSLNYQPSKATVRLGCEPLSLTTSEANLAASKLIKQRRQSKVTAFDLKNGAIIPKAYLFLKRQVFYRVSLARPENLRHQALCKTYCHQRRFILAGRLHRSAKVAHQAELSSSSATPKPQLYLPLHGRNDKAMANGLTKLWEYLGLKGLAAQHKKDLYADNFEPYVGSSVDALSIPLYLRCQLVFKLAKPYSAVPLLESGVSRLIQALPFLSGEFTAVPASDGGKEILLVRPTPIFQLSRILKIKYHETSVHHVIRQMDKPSSQGGDLPHEPYMPYPRLPDPSLPQSIVGFQVNVHTDGIILSVATHHCSFDATGMGSMVQNLAACCRCAPGDEPALTTSPGQEAEARKVLSQIRETPFDPTMFPEYKPLDSMVSYYKGVQSALQGRQTTLVNRCFTIATDKINALKKRCNALIPEMVKKSRCIFFALPGHANTEATSTFGADHSEDDEWVMSFCRVAYGLRAKLNAIDDGYIRDYISYVQKSPCHLSVTLDTENLYVSNWREISVYDADFGAMLGKPLRMRAPDGYSDGLIFVMAQRSEDRTAPWEFNISLEPSAMKSIEHDPLWCKYVALDEFWHGKA
ncbi:hypothetical protein IFM61392_06590 [Aspergillus lentulus]|nr:hypothetical protein IFM61392_06590 [Aspergillus lentulus]